MLKCYGEGCPLKMDCYHFTQPYVKRNAFGHPPYDPKSQRCESFYSNIPSQEFIQMTAYYIWMRAGQPDGQDLAHWEEAVASAHQSTGRARTVVERCIEPVEM